MELRETILKAARRNWRSIQWIQYYGTDHALSCFAPMKMRLGCAMFQCLKKKLRYSVPLITRTSKFNRKWLGALGHTTNGPLPPPMGRWTSLRSETRRSWRWCTPNHTMYATCVLAFLQAKMIWHMCRDMDTLQQLLTRFLLQPLRASVLTVQPQQ